MIRRPPRSTLFSLHDALPICANRFFLVACILEISGLIHWIVPSLINVCIECEGRAILQESAPRSEERRVGKECRSRWSPYDLRKKKKIRMVVSTITETIMCDE